MRYCLKYWEDSISAMSAGGRKLFLGGLTKTTTTDMLFEAFGQFGQVVDAVVMERNGHPRGFGFVTSNRAVLRTRVGGVWRNFQRKLRRTCQFEILQISVMVDYILTASQKTKHPFPRHLVCASKIEHPEKVFINI